MAVQQFYVETGTLADAAVFRVKDRKREGSDRVVAVCQDEEIADRIAEAFNQPDGNAFLLAFDINE